MAHPASVEERLPLEAVDDRILNGLAHLHPQIAYDALTGAETYNSETNAAQDRLEGGRNFTSITVANGRAFVGAQGVFCYGLK